MITNASKWALARTCVCPDLYYLQRMILIRTIQTWRSMSIWRHIGEGIPCRLLRIGLWDPALGQRIRYWESRRTAIAQPLIGLIKCEYNTGYASMWAMWWCPSHYDSRLLVWILLDFSMRRRMVYSAWFMPGWCHLCRNFDEVSLVWNNEIRVEPKSIFRSLLSFTLMLLNQLQIRTVT